MSEAEPSKAKAKRTRKSSAIRTKDDTDKAILKLANKGATEREIAAVTNLPKSTVHHRLLRLRDDPDFIDFKQSKAEVLEELQFKLVNSIDQDTIKTMLNKRGVLDIAILEDKIRTIRGEATSITSIDIRALGLMVNIQQPSQDVIDVYAEGDSSSPEDPV